jgi:hypothetical protein
LISFDQKLLLRGIYITDSADITMTWDGYAVKLVYPTVMDDSAPVKGNLLPNGGFETPVDASWGFVGQGGGRTVPINTMWDSTQGHQGQGSLKLTFDAATRIQPANNADQFISRVYHVKPNKNTRCPWMKASPGLTTTAQLLMHLYSNSRLPAQYILSGNSMTVTDT